MSSPCWIFLTASDMILKSGEPVAIQHIKQNLLIFIKLSKDIRKLAPLDGTSDDAKGASKDAPENNETAKETHDEEGLDAAEDHRIVGGKLQGPRDPVLY